MNERKLYKHIYLLKKYEYKRRRTVCNNCNIFLLFIYIHFLSRYLHVNKIGNTKYKKKIGTKRPFNFIIWTIERKTMNQNFIVCRVAVFISYSHVLVCISKYSVYSDKSAFLLYVYMVWYKAKKRDIDANNLALFYFINFYSQYSFTFTYLLCDSSDYFFFFFIFGK